MKKKTLTLIVIILIAISSLGVIYYNQTKIKRELVYYQNEGYNIKERDWNEYKNQFAPGQLFLNKVTSNELRETAKEINNTLGFCTIFVDYKKNVIWVHIIVSYGQKVAVYWLEP